MQQGNSKSNATAEASAVALVIRRTHAAGGGDPGQPLIEQARGVVAAAESWTAQGNTDGWGDLVMSLGAAGRSKLIVEILDADRLELVQFVAYGNGGLSTRLAAAVPGLAGPRSSGGGFGLFLRASLVDFALSATQRQTALFIDDGGWWAGNGDECMNGPGWVKGG
jgi:hypothetical protein